MGINFWKNSSNVPEILAYNHQAKWQWHRRIHRCVIQSLFLQTRNANIKCSKTIFFLWVIWKHLMDVGEIRSLLFLSVQIIHRFCFTPEHFDGESSCKNSLFCFYFYYLNFLYSFTEMEGTLRRILLWMPGIVPTAVDFPDEVNVLQGEWPWYGKVPPLNMVHHLPAFPHQLSPWWDGSWQAYVEGRSTLRRQRGASAPLETLSLLPLPLSQCHMGKTRLLFLFSSEEARLIL